MAQHVAKANYILDTDGNTVDVSIDNLQEEVKWLKENGTALSPEQVESLAKIPTLSSQLDETMYKNKNILMLGDSIMDICGVPENVKVLLGANVVNGGFQGCMMSYNDNSVYANTKAFSGYAITKAIVTNDYSEQDNAISGNSNLNMYKVHLDSIKALDFSKIDVITIAYGTNDFGFNVQTGTKETDGNTNLAGAMKEVVKNIQTKNPNIEIIFLTPIYRADRLYNNTNSLEDYVTVMKATASLLGVKIIDLFSCSGINEFNFTTLLKDDKLHPNESGSLVEAKAIVKHINKGYVAKTDIYEKPTGLIVDSENLNTHDIRNRVVVKNNKKYLTHSKTDYLRYKDIVLVDTMCYINTLDTVNVSFSYLTENSFSPRFDVALYDTSNNKIFEKTNTLALAATESYKTLNVPIVGTVASGYYRLYIAIKAMDNQGLVYARNFALNMTKYKTVFSGTVTLNVTNDTTKYIDTPIIYNNSADWGTGIIPIPVATTVDDGIICNIYDTQYNNFKVRIRPQTEGANLANGKSYKVNYIVHIPV